MFSQLFEDCEGVREGQECAKRMTRELVKTFEEQRELINSDIWFFSLWQGSIASGARQLEKHAAGAAHVGMSRKLSGSAGQNGICCSYSLKRCFL